jgi:hypothetical protein
MNRPTSRDHLGMIRLTSRDNMILMKVLRRNDLSDEDRLKFLDGASEEVYEIGKGLLHPDQPVENEEIRYVVGRILRWVETVRSIEKEMEERRRRYA